jgi:hypothetical protein
VVEAQLFGAGSPAEVVDEHAVFEMEVALAGRAASTRNPKVAPWLAPGARAPTVSVQVEPGFALGEQLQPEVLEVGSKRV